MQGKSVARWGRGDDRKRRKGKRERDGIPRAVEEEKGDGKRRKRGKKMEAKSVGQRRGRKYRNKFVRTTMRLFNAIFFSIFFSFYG